MYYNEAPAAASTVLAFAFFAGYTACLGYYYDISQDLPLIEFSSDEKDELNTNSMLLYTVTAILCVTTLLYGLFKCIESQCMLILRMVGNFCAMVIFLGYKCEVLNTDGTLELDTYSTESKSTPTVAFALAWVLISTFEVNENSFCKYRCTKWVAKAQLFFFWVLLAVAACFEGEDLLEKAKDAEDNEAKISAWLLLGFAIAAALSALCFVLFSLCEVTEFIRLHMLAGSLTGLLYIAHVGYHYYHFRKTVNEWIDESESSLFKEFYESLLKLLNWQFAGNFCLGVSILCTVGFDQFFLAAPVMVKSSQPQKPAVTIQIAQ